MTGTSLQEFQSLVTQWVGLVITLIFGIEGVVKLAGGAWNTIKDIRWKP